jgi:hypothetical protein
VAGLCQPLEFSFSHGCSRETPEKQWIQERAGKSQQTTRTTRRAAKRDERSSDASDANVYLPNLNFRFSDS